VVHLDGLSDLEGEGKLELRFSDDGLDIVRVRDTASLIQFDWRELHGVLVQSDRGGRLRRRTAQSRLVLTATGRHGRFTAGGADPEELRQRLAPVLTKLGVD